MAIEFSNRVVRFNPLNEYTDFKRYLEFCYPTPYTDEFEHTAWIEKGWVVETLNLETRKKPFRKVETHKIPVYAPVSAMYMGSRLASGIGLALLPIDEDVPDNAIDLMYGELFSFLRDNFDRLFSGFERAEFEKQIDLLNKYWHCTYTDFDEGWIEPILHFQPHLEERLRELIKRNPPAQPKAWDHQKYVGGKTKRIDKETAPEQPAPSPAPQTQAVEPKQAEPDHLTADDLALIEKWRLKRPYSAREVEERAQLKLDVAADDKIQEILDEAKRLIDLAEKSDSGN